MRCSLSDLDDDPLKILLVNSPDRMFNVALSGEGVHALLYPEAQGTLQGEESADENH